VSDTIVITGAAGQLGRFLTAEAARRGRSVQTYTSSQWDITDPNVVETLVASGELTGKTVVNCAAYTNVDAAERDEVGAYAVNATGALNVARACAVAGARLIHVSTDYVFDGDFGGASPRPYEPGDRSAPLNVYGKSKLAGEQAVLSTLPAATVVRTSWLYTGGAGKDFVAVMARNAAAANRVEVVDDQIGSPTYVADLVDALLEVADGAVTANLVHAGNKGAASRYEQARAVYAELGADQDLVRPVSTGHVPRPATRPPFSALGSRISAAAGLTPLRDWREALAEAIRRAAKD
jgi:dTDP-4-dehydrorhamnose reductase